VTRSALSVFIPGTVYAIVTTAFLVLGTCMNAVVYRNPPGLFIRALVATASRVCEPDGRG
jgi:hypothetical protein